ncbi:type II toxin-antitoxin system RelE/ParE family toxin [Pseudomonas syringae pv. actinidiae]|nr:type II toxin-antitoxin system RelE/ParE family toxin [Pseudomonas syringae pv. actinidiae]
MAEYRLTPLAVEDMEGIWKYGVSEWGTNKAVEYTTALTDAFNELADKPSKAKSCDEIRKGYRRLKVERHFIYLTQQPYGVAIVRVLHEVMDQKRHL